MVIFLQRAICNFTETNPSGHSVYLLTNENWLLLELHQWRLCKSTRTCWGSQSTGISNPSISEAISQEWRNESAALYNYWGCGWIWYPRHPKNRILVKHILNILGSELTTGFFILKKIRDQLCNEPWTMMDHSWQTEAQKRMKCEVKCCCRGYQSVHCPCIVKCLLPRQVSPDLEWISSQFLDLWLVSRRLYLSWTARCGHDLSYAELFKYMVLICINKRRFPFVS